MLAGLEIQVPNLLRACCRGRSMSGLRIHLLAILIEFGGQSLILDDREPTMHLQENFPSPKIQPR